MFDAASMNQDPPGLTLTGSSSPSSRAPLGRHARWRELTEAEEAAAMASSMSSGPGRGDLLAEVAGALERFSFLILIGRFVTLDL